MVVLTSERAGAAMEEGRTAAETNRAPIVGAVPGRVARHDREPARSHRISPWRARSKVFPGYPHRGRVAIQQRIDEGLEPDASPIS